MKRALVMSGGEIKGAWQVGALSRYCKAHPDWAPDYISGTSVGAINTLFLAADLARGKTFYEAVANLRTTWEERVTSAAVIAKKRKWTALAFDLLRGEWNGLQSMDPLRLLLEDLTKDVSLHACPIPVEVVTCSLERGTGDYWDLRHLPYRQAIDATMASAMMPIVMPPVKLRGELSYDGGVRDVAPMSGAINAGDCDHILALVTSPPQLSFAEARSLPQLVGRLIANFVNEATNNDLAVCRDINHRVLHGDQSGYRTIQLEVVRPAEEIKLDIWNFTHKDILGMIDQGITDTERCLGV